MKKTLFLITLASLPLLFSSCEKAVFDSEDEDVGIVTDVPNGKTKKFTFTVKGDFSSPVFTRTTDYLSVNNQNMTDLWVFDYVDGVLVQQLHQTPTDETWGAPVLQLTYGQHHVYFVASRGDVPSVDTANHTITWEGSRDTFWKDYEVSVVSTSNGNRAVTLDRVTTLLRVTVNDEVPEGLATVTVTPEHWFYGIDYKTGMAVSDQKRDRTASIASSYVGTSGQVVISIYGISNPEEWTTDVSITAKATNGNTLGSVVIENAPFKRGRATNYSGNLFGSSGSATISLNDEWDDPYNATW